MSRAEATASDVLEKRYRQVRTRSVRLASSLSPEDQQIQAFVEASPTKWHLGHTTWFFETFVLNHACTLWEPIHPAYAALFNSYYEAVGEQHPRHARGILSRPSLEAVHHYRETVDAAMRETLRGGVSADIEAIVTLGLNHEEQHQELLLTDILANFSANPLRPAWRETTLRGMGETPAPHWVEVTGGMTEIGHEGGGFAFDNEAPQHRVFLGDFALRNTTVSCGEVMAFIEDGGYERASLWLSDGLAWVRAHSVEAPAYWRRDADGRWLEHTLYGERPVDAHAPVTHVSGYEADAIATWLGARLPTEEEWETAARQHAAHPRSGRFLEDGPTVPRYPPASEPRALLGLWGETWEWTRSAYAPYPGFRPAAGAVGEYNGKFMANQWVLRGGSCATPAGHVRPSYRNFFYPHQRWQFGGIRLARDLP